MARRRVLWVAAYAVAMAFVESAVVVYLRALAPAEGPLAVLHTVIPERLLAIEACREAATLLMLLAVAALAGATAWQRFQLFSLAFGLWDLFYYVWLRVLIGWPPSLLAWDVLFLVPRPWVAPVLAPVIVSVCLVAGALLLVERHPPRWPAWVPAGVGAALILASFMVDAETALTGDQPPPFRWTLFGAGVLLGLAGLAAALAAPRPALPREAGDS